MEIEVQRWFIKAGTYARRKTYRVLSADSESNHNLEAFKKAEGKGTVHLMFAIDMLNEGLHIPEVGAVILLRPTESPNIFYQQIGRCMEVGKDHVPVIFDLVNNFQNLRANDFLADLEEAREAEVQRRAEQGLTDYTPTIRINELARPIEEIFEAIRNRIGFWGYMFEQLCEYKDTHGDCVVPSTYKVSPSLAIWVSTQRWRYNKNRLPTDQIQQLEQVGFVWSPRETNWDMMYQELCKFNSAHGHCNVSLDDPDNFTLGRWVCKQRSRKSTLSHERILCLEDIGFKWNPVDAARENMFIELCSYREKYGDSNVPDKFDQNPALGTWVGRLRTRCRKGLLSEDWIGRLNAIGFDWDPNSTVWLKMCAALRAYKEKTGDCLIPKKDSDNPALGSWVDSQRQARKKNRLNPEQIQQLDEINFVWDPYESQWNEKYNELCEYKANNGDCNVPDDYPDNRSLGSWVGNQRMVMKKGKLSDDQVKLLEKIGFIWDARSAFWEKMFNALSEYNNKNGHANVPCQYSQFPILARWVNTQRTIWKKGLLPQEKIKRLDELSFDWSPTVSSAETMFSALSEFKKKHGHCNVPRSYPENPSLAVWVGTRRVLMKNSRLDAEQIRRLDELGFEWDRNFYDKSWDTNYAALCSFKEANAHCNVPQSYSTLGRWVSKQRQRRRKGQLPEVKINRLDDIGFTWEPKG